MDRRCRKLYFGVLVLLAMSYQANSYREVHRTDESDKCASRKMDLVVVMDGTISLGYEPFNLQRDFVLAVLSKMKFGPGATQLGIIQFSDRWSTSVEMEIGRHGRQQEVLKNVSNIVYQRGLQTMTGLAMHLGYEQLFGGNSQSRPGVDKVILLITDGKPIDIILLQNVVKDLKDKGVRIVSVAIGTSNNRIQRFRYIVRTIASGFKQSFKAEHGKLKYLVDDVATEVCRSNNQPHPPGKAKLQQKCFQEKKDILFALDGSRDVNTNIFNKAKSLVAKICAQLDITPNLIHVAMLQYSDELNTRIEFDLDQYTKYYQINESLQNVFHSRGRRSNLERALSIVDEKIFNGENGDRISAEDYLLLFLSDVARQSESIVNQVKRLREKGVHVIIIGLGRPQPDFYETLASHPSDVNYIDTVLLKHIVGDLTAITCRKVKCKEEEEDKTQLDKRETEEKESSCKQSSQDVLFMIDTTRSMNGYFEKALKFFTKVVKKLNIAATQTDVGLMTFGGYGRHINIKMGKFKFEQEISKRFLKIRQTERRSHSRGADVARALRLVSKEVFNTSTGGHRETATDLIFIATRGIVRDRYGIQQQVKLLRDRGVRIAVLDVAYKNRKIDYFNAIRDIASSAREIYPMDFRRASTIPQALLDVRCKAVEKIVSPECFAVSRKVLFMLDSSRGLGYRDLPKVIRFIKDILIKLYTNPNNIEVGMIHYSDLRTIRYAMSLGKWSLRRALRNVDRLSYTYRQGRKNYLGYALKFAKRYFARLPARDEEERIVVLLAHNQPADPERAFRISEQLRSQEIEIVTVAIHTEKNSIRINPQYRALATSRANAHSFDLNNLKNSSIDVLLNLCELAKCPEDSTKHCTPKKQDIFMVLDSSRSIGYRIYPKLRRFVRRLVNKLDVSHERTHLGILQASDDRRTQYEMKLGEFRDSKEIESVINEMGYHEGFRSYIGKGLSIAIGDNLFNASGNAIPNGFSSNNDRPEAENVLMIYSDGNFHDEPRAKRIIENLKQLGVRVVVVGLGRESRRSRERELLESLATTNADVYLVNLHKASLLVEEELNEVAQNVISLNCVDKHPAPIQCSPESLDLFVVIDGSRSVGYINFGKVKNFLKKLSDEFLIGENNAHFGVLQFGDKVKSRIEFNLDKYLSNKAVSKAIEKMEFLDSTRTDTGHALSVVNNEIFNGTGVDRPGVPNILILFTDGLAHDIRLAYTEAEELKRKGTRIIAIGAGREANKVFQQIKRVASREEDAHKSNFDELSGIVDDLLDVVCT